MKSFNSGSYSRAHLPRLSSILMGKEACQVRIPHSLSPFPHSPQCIIFSCQLSPTISAIALSHPKEYCAQQPLLGRQWPYRNHLSTNHLLDQKYDDPSLYHISNTPHDKDRDNWYMGSHIAWEREVLAPYNVSMKFQLYHWLIVLEYRSCNLSLPLGPLQIGIIVLTHMIRMRICDVWDPALLE